MRTGFTSETIWSVRAFSRDYPSTRPLKNLISFAWRKGWMLVTVCHQFKSCTSHRGFRPYTSLKIRELALNKLLEFLIASRLNTRITTGLKLPRTYSSSKCQRGRIWTALWRRLSLSQLILERKEEQQPPRVCMRAKLIKEVFRAMTCSTGPTTSWTSSPAGESSSKRLSNLSLQLPIIERQPLNSAPTFHRFKWATIGKILSCPPDLKK